MLNEPTPYENDLATQIIGCAMIVHRHFGPGLVESVYETCFYHELAKAGLQVVRQKRQPIVYDGITFDDPFKMDKLQSPPLPTRPPSSHQPQEGCSS